MADLLGKAPATLPAPVMFDPPLAPADLLPAGVRIPACPSCGEGTVFLNVCGGCGNTDPGPYCCGQFPSLRGAYVSVLPGEHAWTGCPLANAKAA
jgi:hypothetical protein